MFKKHIWFFVILFGLMLNSTALLAQKHALTNEGKKVVLYANYTWKYDTAALTIPERLELPEFKNNQNITYHSGFTLCYNKAHEQSNWVAYQLTAAETQGTAQRSNTFKPDPKVKVGTATDADYKQSGYDRGHLAPAADMSWSETAMQESFYYSNMSPQVPSFNRGIWKKLEEQVRDWAVQFDEIYVATGPVLTAGLPHIGPNKVSVPSLYYKALLVYGNKGKQAIAFVVPNEASQQPLNNYAVTIDSLENLTGINFFAALQDDEEALIEANVHAPLWGFQTSTQKQNTTEKRGEATQCKGFSKSSNAPCKLRTTNANGYCHHHQNQIQTAEHTQDNLQINSGKPTETNASKALQCSGTTKAGNRCKRTTTNASGRCYQH
jgi:endonuclease G